MLLPREERLLKVAEDAVAVRLRRNAQVVVEVAAAHRVVVLKMLLLLRSRRQKNWTPRWMSIG
jgi:hypothetical protein